MTDYTVTFRKQIHSNASESSSNDVFLEHTVALPFVPFVGLTVTEGEDDFCVHDFGPGSVLWLTDTQRFIVYDETDETLYNRPNLRPIDEIVDEWLEQGWDRTAGRWPS